MTNISGQGTPREIPFKANIKEAVADGHISHAEYASLRNMVEGMNVSFAEKQAFCKLLDKARDYTNVGFFSDGVLEIDEMNNMKKLAKKYKNSQLASEFFKLFEENTVPRREQFFLVSIFQRLFGNPNQKQPFYQSSSHKSTYTPETQESSNSGPKNISFVDGGADSKIDASKYHWDAEVTYEKSPYHDKSKFIPTYAMTAYHESGSYRSEEDPYAVGTITTPAKRDDLGGKTYGVYQFESSVYANGERGKNADYSTLMRFVRWADNPYSQQLKKAVDEHGLASPEFDKVWQDLAINHNQDFGLAQQNFLKHDKLDDVQAFFERANIAQTVRQDERIFDLIMGTTNHVGSLADSLAEHLGEIQKKAGRSFSADELGKAITDFKKQRVASWFKSSPGAHDGIHARFEAESQVFNA